MHVFAYKIGLGIVIRWCLKYVRFILKKKVNQYRNIDCHEYLNNTKLWNIYSIFSQKHRIYIAHSITWDNNKPYISFVFLTSNLIGN